MYITRDTVLKIRNALQTAVPRARGAFNPLNAPENNNVDREFPHLQIWD